MLLVVFAVLTLLAVNQLFVLADVADQYWAWTIHTEMTAAFIGAAYAAGFVLSVLSLRQGRWSRIRIPLITVTVFTVLTAVATLRPRASAEHDVGGPVARPRPGSGSPSTSSSRSPPRSSSSARSCRWPGRGPVRARCPAGWPDASPSRGR